MRRVRDFGDVVLVRVHAVRAALIDRAERIAEDDVLGTHAVDEARDGLSGSTGTVDDEPYLREVAARELERIDERGDDDDGRAVLIIVEYRDVELLAEFIFDIEALRCLDILKVYAAKARCDELDGADDLIGILRVEADREGVDAGEAFEEDGLALHDGEPGARADVAETEYGRAVRNDGDHVALCRVIVNFLRVIFYGQARSRDAWGVGKREVFRFLQRNFADDLDFSLMFFM